MNKYISILRGINISGQKKILMLDLKIFINQLVIKILKPIFKGAILFLKRMKQAQKSKLHPILKRPF